jgi:tRNA(adenine34) deaminase
MVNRFFAAGDDAGPMTVAIVEALKAGERGEVPIGAVAVDGKGRIVAAAGNRSIECNDPTAHAEILALRKAGEQLGNYRLPDLTLYVTLEPCAMCAAAMVHARIKRLVYGADDPKAGAITSKYRIGSDGLLNHRFKVEGGCRAQECAALLKDFFKGKRE